jgi:hypothetical protein
MKTPTFLELFDLVGEAIGDPSVAAAGPGYRLSANHPGILLSIGKLQECLERSVQDQLNPISAIKIAIAAMVVMIAELDRINRNENDPREQSLRKECARLDAMTPEELQQEFNKKTFLDEISDNESGLSIDEDMPEEIRRILESKKGNGRIPPTSEN